MVDFSLDINEIQKDVENSIKKEEDELKDSNLKDKAENNVLAIFEMDLDNVSEREAILKPMDQFGLADINKSSNKNQMLSKRCVDLQKSSSDAIGDDLLELNRQIKALDPGKVDFTSKGVLGSIFNPIKKYFSKYEKAEDVISEIIESLNESKKVLENDNTTLLNEEEVMRETTKRLLANVELGKDMDLSIENQIRNAEINGIEEEKINFVKEEILFPLRQRIMDIEEMVLINQQAIISLNVIRKNNKELIRGVNRAENVTMSALRVGVMLASALYNQKIVMDKLNILNDTTEQIIQSTSRMLREQGVMIQKQSSETMLSPEVLKASFDEAVKAIEDLSVYKQNALPKMKETIEMFNDMAIKGQEVVDRIESNNNLLN